MLWPLENGCPVCYCTQNAKSVRSKHSVSKVQEVVFCPLTRLEIERTDRCCSETESVTAQICSGRNRTEPHTQISASCRRSLTPQARDVRILKYGVRISLRILTTDPHPHSPHRLPAAAMCPIHLSLASWVTEEQLTAAAAEHGHRVTQIEHVRQHYTIASAHCAQQVSLPSAELELLIHVGPRPRIFGGEPSASVRGSQEFLRICVRRRPSVHFCCRPPWSSAQCGKSHAGMAIISATAVI